MSHNVDCQIWLPKCLEALRWQAGLTTVSATFQLRTFAGVTSHNTPVTMLTNFWLVPGHAVTSFAFRDSRNLGFMLELGCKAPNTTRPDIIVTPSHFQFFRIMEDSYPQPYLLL